VRRAFVLQYLGTRYAGWQAQENALAIQTVVERVLAKIHHSGRIALRGSARTDAGVHALMQVAHADLPHAIPPDGLARGMNALLPDDVRVREVLEVGPEFDALGSAIGKEYRYRLWRGRVRPPFLAATTGRSTAPLDVDRIRAAARLLPGHRDFRLFAKVGSDPKTTVRDLREVTVAEDGELLTLGFVASGFLRGTVRLLAGTLVDVGRGRLAVDAPARLLGGDENAGRVGPSLEASGLFLWRVDYPPHDGPRPVPAPPGLW